MRNKNAARRIAVVLAVALAVPFAAQADIITLQIPNVPGDTRFAANNGLPADSIRVLTISNTVVNRPDCAGGGSCSGRPVFSDVSIVKRFGESSAPLFLAVARGIAFPTATLSFYRLRQGVPVRYYTITLQEVNVVSQQWIGNSNAADSPDAENLALSYSRITLLDNETGARACYDLRSALVC
ncbi:MAG TPA: type VI secretion system tube protein Hcp [Steroidobacteraceae bacterium]|nr:type VI secretion system tube protein Hcp [Steroidobacteraceae bacterium]